MSVLTVVKLGGSLCADEARLAHLLRSLADGVHGRCVIVPGGGGFADAVRAAQTRERFDDAAAHRLALDAMGRMAEVFCGIEPRLVLFQTVARATLARTGEREEPAALVWDPVLLTSGRPCIPETWDVTSDSLALWLAREVGAARCVLVKSADVRSGRSPAELSRIGLVDAAFPAFAARFAGRIELWGPNGVATPADRAAA